MSFTTVTVTGSFIRADGITPSQGEVLFRLTSPLYDPDTETIVSNDYQRAVMDDNGNISIVLTALDDVGIVPQGAQYEVTEHHSFGRTFQYLIEVTVADAPTADLATLVVETGTVPHFDASLAVAVAARVRRGGDTMTGPLALFGDPTTALQAATKQYVDVQLSLGPSPSGDTTGVTDREAINAAAAALSVAGSGVLVLPSAVATAPYYLSVAGAHKECLLIPSNVEVKGPTAGGTWVRLVGNPTSTASIVSMRGAIKAGFDNVTIDGDSEGANTHLAAVQGLVLNGSLSCNVGRGVRVTSCSLHDIIITQSYDNILDSPDVDKWGDTTTGGTGIGCGIVIFDGSSRNQVLNVRVNGLDRVATGTIGVLIDASSTGGGGTPCEHNTVTGIIYGAGTSIQIEDSHRNFTDVVCYQPGYFGYVVQEGQDSIIPVGNNLGAPTVVGSGTGVCGIADSGQDTVSAGGYVTGCNAGLRIAEAQPARPCKGNRHSTLTVTNMVGTTPIPISFCGSGITIDRPVLRSTGTVYKGIAQVSGGVPSSGNAVIGAEYENVTTTLGALHSEAGAELAVIDTHFGAGVVGDGIVAAAGTESISIRGTRGTVSGNLESIDASVVVIGDHELTATTTVPDATETAFLNITLPDGFVHGFVDVDYVTSDYNHRDDYRTGSIRVSFARYPGYAAVVSAVTQTVPEEHLNSGSGWNYAHTVAFTATASGAGADPTNTVALKVAIDVTPDQDAFLHWHAKYHVGFQNVTPTFAAA